MSFGFCGEIQYHSNVGIVGNVHSDICWNHEKLDIEMTKDIREFMHDCLDEWLSKSDGTGYFWICNPIELQAKLEDD